MVYVSAISSSSRDDPDPNNTHRDKILKRAAPAAAALLAAAILFPATDAGAAKWPADAKVAIDALSKAIAPFPSIGREFRKFTNANNVAYDKATNSWTATKGKFSLVLMKSRRPKSKYEVALVVSGKTKITPKGAPWSKLAAVSVRDAIFSYGQAPRQATLGTLAPKLKASASVLYRKTLPLVKGFQFTAGLDLADTKNTLLGDAIALIDKAEATRAPGKVPQYVLRSGLEKGAKKKKKGKKANAFIEMRRRGTWPGPLGMPATQLANATIYFDKSSTLGLWGTLVLVNPRTRRPNFVTMAYKGPISPKITKKQIEAIQIGFGAPEMTLETYGRLLTASAYAQSTALRVVPLIRTMQGKAANSIIQGLQTLPLGFIKVTNPAWQKQDGFPFTQAGGRYLAANRYNVLVLGPRAANAPAGVRPPLVQLKGDMKLFGKKIAGTSTVFDRNGLRTASSASVKLPFGKIGGMALGNPSARAKFGVEVTRAKQAVLVGGKLRLPAKFGSINFGYVISRTGGYFETPATCAFPFEINAIVPANEFTGIVRNGRVTPGRIDTANLLSSLAGRFTLSVPDTVGNMASCAEDLFYMVVDGALVAFNKAGEVARVATGKLVDGADEVAAFGGAAAKVVGNKLVPGGKAAYRAAQKTGGRIGGYARYTATNVGAGAGRMFGGGAKEFQRFTKNPGQSFKRGMNTFNRGWKMATNPRKTLNKTGKTVKKTGKKVLKELEKACFWC